MATSYSNPGGSGDRRSIITVTPSSLLIEGTGAPYDAWIDGSTTDNVDWWDQADNTGRTLQFDFGSGASKVIDEVKYYQETSAGQGNWKWQGSNDAAAWTDIGSSFALGGTTTQTITAMSGNTTGYRYYRIIGTGGNTSDIPYVREFEFKIDDAGGGAPANTTNFFQFF